MQAQPTKESGFRWVVLTLIFLVYMIAGADRANIGVVVPVIKDEFKLSNTDIGAMSSLFYIGYALIQVPAGAFYSKFGIRKLFNFSIVLTSIATFLMGLTVNAFQLKAARVLLGFAEGPLNIGCISLINRWFPSQEKGLATGVFMSSIKLAPALVPPICAFIIISIGWREIFWVFALPGFVLAVVFYILVRDNPEDSRRCSPAEADYIARDKAMAAEVRVSGTAPHWIDRLVRSRSIEPMDDQRVIAKSWNVWGCAIGYGCLVGIAYAIMTWVPTYLVTVKKFSIMKMGFVATAPWVGAIVGNVVGGWMSDKLFERRRKPVMMLTSASTIVMMYALLYAPNEPFALALLLFVAGVFLNLGYSTFLVYPMGIASRRTSSFAISIVNMCGSLGGAFAPFVVGVILDSFNWDSVFLFLAVCSLVTLTLLFTIIEPRPTLSLARDETKGCGRMSWN